MRQLEAEMREQLPLKPRVAAPKTLEGDPRQQQQGGERVEFLARSKRATWEARERAKRRRVKGKGGASYGRTAPSVGKAAR